MCDCGGLVWFNPSVQQIEGYISQAGEITLPKPIHSEENKGQLLSFDLCYDELDQLLCSTEGTYESLDSFTYTRDGVSYPLDGSWLVAESASFNDQG